MQPPQTPKLTSHRNHTLKHKYIKDYFSLLIDDMPLHCSSMAIKASHNLGLVRLNNKHKLITNHLGTISFSKTHHHRISKPIACLSKLTQTQSFTVMEDPKRSSLSSLQPTQELEIAVRAVQMACSLCQKVQDSLISKSGAVVQSKDDNSPVTVAGLFLHFSTFFYELGRCKLCLFELGSL